MKEKLSLRTQLGFAFMLSALMTLIAFVIYYVALYAVPFIMILLAVVLMADLPFKVLLLIVFLSTVGMLLAISGGRADYYLNYEPEMPL